MIYPAIEDYGGVQPLPEAGMPPDPSLDYQVVFDVAKAAAAADQVNPGFERVARFVNLLALGGVTPQPGKLVAVLHGPATVSVLRDEAHIVRTDAPNPNLPLLRRLREHGVEVHVCGQALAEHGIDPAEVETPPVQVDLAAMTSLAAYQRRGFALVPL